MPIQIRAEQGTDIDAIHTLLGEAFADVPGRGRVEQSIVRALRDAGELSVSLVACQEGGLVGQVALSRVFISDDTADWYGLGPVGVRPSCQRQGIGSGLMSAALDALRHRRAGGCVLLGDPAFYRRFGFAPMEGLLLPGVPAEYFLALSLNGARPRGQVRYHEAFSIS